MTRAIVKVKSINPYILSIGQDYSPSFVPSSNSSIYGFAVPGKQITCLRRPVTSYGDFIEQNSQWYTSTGFNNTNAQLVQISGNIDQNNNLYSYTVQTGDVSKFISCIVSYNDTYGTVSQQCDWRLLTSYIHPTISGQFSPGYIPVIASGNPLPTPVLLTGFANATSFTGHYIYANHEYEDSAGYFVPGSGMIYDTGSPQSGINWSFVAAAASYPTIDGNPLNDYTRINHRPPILISPSFCVGAAHWFFQGGTGNTQAGSILVDAKAEWLTTNNVVVSGNYTPALYQNLWYPGEPSADDLVVFKMDNPITGVTPIGILTDVSKVANRTGLAIELDRHLTATIIDSATSNDVPYIDFTLLNTGDILEPGDSGMPHILIISGKPVLLGCHHTATQMSNMSYFIHQLNAILSQYGEQLTLYDLP